jgi:hypothetical protein
MLKFLYVARISNFYTFLVDFSHDFKHVVLFLLDELLSLPFMVKKLEMSSFQPNLNRRNIPPITPDMFQTVHKGVI